MKFYRNLVLLFLPLELCGQVVKEYSLHFDMNDFLFEDKNGMVQIISKNKDYVIWGDTIDPALPCLGMNILISPTEEYVRVEEKYNEKNILSDVYIEPNPMPAPTNLSMPLNERRYLVYDKTNYPQMGIEYTGTHLMDGYKYLSFVVCPFRYNALNKRLYLKTDITLRLHLITQNDLMKSKDAPSKLFGGNNMRDMIKKNVLNNNEIEYIYDSNTSIKERTSSASDDYIIVTNELLRPVFEKLAKWKTIKGVKAKVITVEQCTAEYPNYTSQLAIKTVLADYYADGMKYVLLGGDTDVVPAQICDLPNWTEYTTDTPSDLYYACLDNCFSWDANGNHIYGELSDNVDLDPEFIVTRASVSSLSEAEIFINRIIEYESSPKLEEWSNKMLSCGNILKYYCMKNNVQISDAQYQGEFVYENGVQNYWNGTLFKLFDTYTDHADGADYEANAEHLQLELAKGYTFVDEFSHAFANVWGWLENWSKYNLSHADSLVNSGYTTISTISCYSNAFDKISTDFPDVTDYYTTCLSEAFIRNPNSGVLAYLGSSREGWIYYSYYFDEKYYEMLLSSSQKQFGRAAMFAKNSFLSYVSSVGFNNYRWLIMTLNPIGDPEMPIFTDTPQIFPNVNVVFSNGNLNVTTGVPDCRICVSSVADYGNGYYELADSTNTASFTGINNDCYLCITKTGYIPYVARVGTTVYLQNETILKDLPIFSTNTYIGSDVTSTKDQGPVSIEKGKVTNKSQGAVTIKNNFEIKKGAELEIIN